MRWMILAAALTASSAMMAQATAATANDPVAAHPIADLEAQAKALVPKAQASSTGIASLILDKFPGGTLGLYVRAKDGGAEVHQNFNDVLIVVDGEGREVTGGTVANGKQETPGEIRGAKVVGGTPHMLRKGDVLHIAPGVPHQSLLVNGKPFAYMVVKVAKQ